MWLVLCAVLFVSCRSDEISVHQEDTSAEDDQKLFIDWTEVNLENANAPIRILKCEEITGFAHEKNSDVAPVTVDGKTVLVVTTKDGYAAVWTEEDYVPGEIPDGPLYCFDEIDMIGAAVEPSIVLCSYPEAMNGRVFSFGWGWSSATATLYCFDDSDTLLVMDAIRGYFAQETDADGDGKKELMVKDFNYRSHLWSYSDGAYRTAMLDTETTLP